MQRNTRRGRWILAGAVGAALAAVGSAHAASDTWSGAANGNFNDTGNWLGGTVPGNTSAGATATTETATFNNAANTTVFIDSGRTTALQTFSGTAGAFTFSGGPLYFYGGGATIATGVTNSQTYNVSMSGSPANRGINFNRAVGVGPGAIFNLNGNIAAGGSGGSGGAIGFNNHTVAMVRGVISNPSVGTGATTLTLDFNGNLVWLRGNNTYTGTTGITRGMWVFDSVTPVTGGASSLGNPSSVANGTMTLGSTGAANEQTLYYAGFDSAGHSTNREIRFGNASNIVLAASGTGPLTWTGGVTSSQTTSAMSNTFILAGASIADNVYGGIVADNSAALTSLRKRGEGTWNLTGTNTYTGTTEVYSGLLRLDFAGSGAPVSNIINSVSPLILGGGDLAVRGNAGAANSQTFNGASLREGYASLELSPGSGGTLTVALGALARTPTTSAGVNPGHVLNVSLNGGTVTTSTSTLTNSVLTDNGVAYVSVDKAGWATVSGGNIVALGSYQTDANPANWVGTDNVSLSGNPSAVVGTQSINTLRLNGSSAVAIGGTDILTVGAGGILFAGTGTNSISGGTLKGADASVKDLVVIQHNTSTAAEISSTIANTSAATSFTKGGDGTLKLSGTNSYTGGTTIGAGVLKVTSATALGGSATTNGLKFAGGVLGLAGGDLTLGVGSGTTAGGPKVRWFGSGGFAAYGADRTITLDSDTSYFFSLNEIAGGSTPQQQRNGELLLGASDSDAKINLAMASGDFMWISRGASAPYIGTIRVANGSAPVDAEISAPMVNAADAKGGIQKMGTGVLQLSSAANTYNGPTIIGEGGLLVTGSISNSMLTEVRSGAWLGGNGTTGAIELRAGGKIKPGMSIGTLSTSQAGNGYLLWNGESSAIAQMQFELSGTDNTSDRINLGADVFQKGSGTTFEFEFAGGKPAETYTLVQFGSTTFTSTSEFAYTSPGGAVAGYFTLNSNNLQFTVTAVPEPGSLGLLGMATAGLLSRRRRK